MESKGLQLERIQAEWPVEREKLKAECERQCQERKQQIDTEREEIDSRLAALQKDKAALAALRQETDRQRDEVRKASEQLNADKEKHQTLQTNDGERAREREHALSLFFQKQTDELSTQKAEWQKEVDGVCRQVESRERAVQEREKALLTERQEGIFFAINTRLHSSLSLIKQDMAEKLGASNHDLQSRFIQAQQLVRHSRAHTHAHVLAGCGVNTS